MDMGYAAFGGDPTEPTFPGRGLRSRRRLEEWHRLGKKPAKDGNKLAGLEPNQVRRQLAKTLRSPL
jgi:hypothetical protein